MPASFREQAERRIAQLEDHERERQITAEARAAEQRAGQVADRERREQAQRDAQAEADAECRVRLARRFGPTAAERVDLGAEYHVFSIEHRGLAAAYRRGAAAHHPGGGAPGRAPALIAANGRSQSWQHQARLQTVLNVGVAMPVLARGDTLLTAVGDVARLLVDPPDLELESDR